MACSQSSLRSDQGLADAVDSILENVFHSEASSPRCSVHSSLDSRSVVDCPPVAVVEEDQLEGCEDTNTKTCARSCGDTKPPSCQGLSVSKACETVLQMGALLSYTAAVCMQMCAIDSKF